MRTTTVTSSGNWATTLTSQANGVHVYTATVTDSGITSTSSNAVSVTVDIPDPPVIYSPSNGATINSRSLTVTGGLVSYEAIRLYDGSTLVGTTVTNFSGHWAITLTSQSSGVHVYTATVTDSGITSTSSNAVSVTVIIPLLDRPYNNDLQTIYDSRVDLQTAFPEVVYDDFGRLYVWASQSGIAEYITILGEHEAVYDLMLVYESRPDLQTAFPEAAYNAGILADLYDWAVNYGVNEHANILGEHEAEYQLGPPL